VSEYLVNPRRSARAPSRCTVLVHAPSSAWKAETEDIGVMGCQLVAPEAVGRGQRLLMIFANPKVQGTLQVEGQVAWGSSQPPWRIGVSFAEASRVPAERWFAKLVSAHPGLAGARRVPDRLPIDAMLFLSPPPTFLVDFTPEEVEVLRHVASGIVIGALRTRLASRWNVTLRAIFSLLSRGLVTVSRSASAHPSTWKKVMEDLETDFVIETRRPTGSMPIVELPVARRAPRFDEKLDLDLDPRFTPPPELAQMPAISTVPAAAPRERPAAPPAGAGPSSAGTGWRGGQGPRSALAQECFDLGRLELAAGRSHSAMAHLRRALQLAPGDPEIAAEIGRAMAKG
jgi:hypothetical protein